MLGVLGFIECVDVVVVVVVDVVLDVDVDVTVDAGGESTDGLSFNELFDDDESPALFAVLIVVV